MHYQPEKSDQKPAQGGRLSTVWAAEAAAGGRGLERPEHVLEQTRAPRVGLRPPHESVAGIGLNMTQETTYALPSSRRGRLNSSSIPVTSATNAAQAQPREEGSTHTSTNISADALPHNIPDPAASGPDTQCELLLFTDPSTSFALMTVVRLVCRATAGDDRWLGHSEW